MKNLVICLLAGLVFISCGSQPKENVEVVPENWSERVSNISEADSLLEGKTYLSVYSEIYSQNEKRLHSLTATVSIRNMNSADTVYISKAEYFNTHGTLIRTYFDQMVYVLPMETLEIIISSKDKEGGTGGNFLFEWSAPGTAISPQFEAVMISTSGQQGISFTTTGVELP